MDEKHIHLSGFLRLLDYGLRREGDETFTVSEEGIRAFPMTDEDWRLLTDEEQIVLMETAEEARLDFPCSLADVRQWVELNWPEIPENLALALVEAEPGKAPGGEGQATDTPVEDAPCNACQGQAMAAATVNPRDLELVVEVRPERIVVTNRSTQTITTYGREDLLGKAEKGWALLCLFAKHYNALPAKLPNQLHELNTPSNRRHLGGALKRRLALKESPVIRQNPASLAFASLRAEYEGIDAMDRQTVSLDTRDRRPAAYDDEDDPAADWLKEHDPDYPADD